MKNIAKWILICWSIFCLIGVVVGMANVGSTLQSGTNEAQRAGASIGAGCGMAMWVGIWGAIALPALIIYLVGGKSRPIQVAIESQIPSRLCVSCGKYYAGQPRFCPNCGQSAA
jgi:predicted DNA repair protein MutK